MDSLQMSNCSHLEKDSVEKKPNSKLRKSAKFQRFRTPISRFGNWSLKLP
jgi:hypothetical protein